MRYFDDKVCYIDDEISYTFTLAFLWRVCVGVYYGIGGVLYRPCSMSIIVSSFSFCCTVLRNLLDNGDVTLKKSLQTFVFTTFDSKKRNLDP